MFDYVSGMLGLFTPANNRHKPTSDTILIQKYVPDTHHVEINNHVQNFNKTLLALKEIDKNIIFGLAVGAVCYTSAYFLPMITIAILAFSWAAYNYALRAAQHHYYLTVLKDLKRLYNWVNKDIGLTDNFSNDAKLLATTLASYVKPATLGLRAITTLQLPNSQKAEHLTTYLLYGDESKGDFRDVLTILQTRSLPVDTINTPQAPMVD